MWAGNLPLSQVTQAPIPPGPEHLQQWGIHSLSEQPVTVPQQPYSKELLLITDLNLLQFKAISPCLVTTCACETPLQSCMLLYALDINQLGIYQDIFPPESSPGLT